MTDNPMEYPAPTGGGPVSRRGPEPVLPEYLEPAGPGATMAGVPLTTTPSRATKIGRTAGGALGTAVRYWHKASGTARTWRSNGIKKDDVVKNIERFVRQHPASLLGAGVAGFMLGRALRGR